MKSLSKIGFWPQKNNLKNKKCPCGSAKKFKHCCFRKKELDVHEITEVFKRNASKRVCLVPEELSYECEGRCSSHSVSKKSVLNTITENGHLQSIKNDVYSNEGIFVDRIGINKASTFNGFCAKHDNDLFKRIDDFQHELDRESIFFFSYRTICMEYFKKAAQVEALKELKNKSGQVQKQIFKTKLDYENVAMRDIKKEKVMYDQNLLSQSYNSIDTLEIAFDNILPIVASTSLFPYYDLDLNLLQDPDDLDTEMQMFNVNVINKENKGYLIFTSQSKNVICNKFYNSLLNKDINLAFVLNFLFEYTENIFLSPVFWENQSQELKDIFIDKFRYSLKPLPNYIKDLKESELLRAQILFEHIDLKGIIPLCENIKLVKG
tara:strand:- start:84 stop:1217 length:1134 start_codon:yes stop_codon:yes gene_type:complete